MASEIAREITLNFPISFQRRIDYWLGGLKTSYGSVFSFLLAFSEHMSPRERARYNEVAYQLLQRKLATGSDRFSFRAQLTLAHKSRYLYYDNAQIRCDILSSMLALGIIEND